MTKSLIACVVALMGTIPVWAGPRVEIVVGDKAPALEKLAADELVSQLKRVYDADAKIGTTVPPNAEHLIWVGSPATNPHLKPFEDQWHSGGKRLTDQGLLVKSVTHQGRPALMIGGGSPVATFWAVAEYGHRIGIRSLLYGDLFPVAPPVFQLDGFAVVEEPTVRWREWRFAAHMPFDSGAWGKAEFRAVLKQVAKLKFNRVELPINASQKTDQLPSSVIVYDAGAYWGRRQIAVAGDTAGRKAFAGAKLFGNPDFISVSGDDARTAISDSSTFPNRFQFAAMEFGLMTRSRTQKLQPTNPANVTPLKPAMSIELNSPVSLLPLLRHTQMAVQFEALLATPAEGVVVQSSFVGDLDFNAYWMSRACWGHAATTSDTLRELLTPVCGEEVDTRVAKAFELVSRATEAVDSAKDGTGAFDVLTSELKSASPTEPPAWWGTARTDYLNAMNEMYRANTRAREGSRSFTLYFARRFEFAFEYMNCIEAVRKSRLAELKKDSATQVAELEKAIESLNNSLNAMAAVARSNSDRGLIATLNEFGYRPLKKKLAEVESAAQ